MAIASTHSTSAGGECATVYVTLELSQARWLVAVHAPEEGDKISRHEIGGGDSAALIALVDKVHARVAERLGREVRIVSCYEAGYDGFWLHRVLRAHGIENQVMDPASLPVNRKPRRAKTDRIDVASLLRTLMAWHRGEPRVCSMVRVPSPEQEDQRRRARERGRLVSERAGHLNRIRGLLMAQGIRTFKPLRRDWESRLTGLRTGDGRPLPPHLKAELARICQRLWQVQTMIVTLDREARAERQAAQEAVQDAAEAQTTACAGEAAAPRGRTAALLTRLKGVGPVSADTLSAEVFFRNFQNRKELAGYVGLTSSPFQSGASAVDQGLSRAGNRRARTVMVELAWLWLRFQPDSTLSRWFHARVGDARGRLRRIMIVALARKLLVALWRYVTTGLVPEGAVLSS